MQIILWLNNSAFVGAFLGVAITISIGKASAATAVGVEVAAGIIAAGLLTSTISSLLNKLRDHYYKRVYPQSLIVGSLLQALDQLEEVPTPAVVTDDMKAIVSWLDGAASILEDYMPRALAICDQMLESGIREQLSARAAKLREVAAGVAVTTHASLESGTKLISRSLLDAIFAQWGAFTQSEDWRQLASNDRKARFVASLKRWSVIVIVVVSIYFLQSLNIAWLSQGFRGSATVALAVLAFQLILAQIDPIAAQATGNVIRLLVPYQNEKK